KAKLWMVGTVARNNIDVAEVVDGRGCICHPYAAATAGACVVLRTAAPHVCRGATVGKLHGVKRDDPTRRTPLPFATAERDHDSLGAAWFGHQREPCPLHLQVPVETSPADVVTVDLHRPEFVVA